MEMCWHSDHGLPAFKANLVEARITFEVSLVLRNFVYMRKEKLS